MAKKQINRLNEWLWIKVIYEQYGHQEHGLGIRLPNAKFICQESGTVIELLTKSHALSLQIPACSCPVVGVEG